MKKIAGIIAGVLGFTACGFTACNKNTDITVYMPDGAPALALAKMLKEDTVNDGITYHVVNPQTLDTCLSYNKESQNADICVMPLTDATKLLGGGDRYVLLGVVTHGNLYILSQNQTPITDVSVLAGEKIGVLQLQKTPGQVFKSILHKNGVENVTLQGITGGGEVGVLENVNYYVLAEPAATAQKSKGYHIVGDIQALYGANGFPQAVLVAKTTLVEEKPQFVKQFVNSVQDASQWLNLATGEEIVSAVSSHTASGYATTLKAPLLQTQVLLRCGVYFTGAQDSKAQIQSFLGDVMQIDNSVTVIPDDTFYCTIDFNA